MPDIVSGDFRLSDEQRAFKKMINAYPNLANHWDWEKLECDLIRVESSLRVLSTGEAVMLRFFAGVWLGINTHGFDLFAAIKHLDEPELELVKEWIASPYFP